MEVLLTLETTQLSTVFFSFTLYRYAYIHYQQLTKTLTQLLHTQILLSSEVESEDFEKREYNTTTMLATQSQ